MKHMHPTDRIAAIATGIVAFLVVLGPLIMAWQLLDGGGKALSWGFLWQAPQDAGRSGGIGPVLLSTVWVLSVCLLAAVPIGLGAALFLVETVDAKSHLGKSLQLALDVLGGIPSIVFGLFGNRFFCVELGMGFSILSGGLTLACMVLPLFVRSTEQALRACPSSYRQAANALNISRIGFIWHVMLPFALPGLAVGLVLAAGRALAETAVLLFTAGYVTRWPETWFDSGRTLAVHIYDLAMNVAGGTAPAAATALVLLGVALMFQALAHGIVRWQAQGNPT
jgi:phosphate transport system permease protein